MEDDGPGLDADRAAALTRRGERGDEAVPGQGIGLAVVSEILAARGGALEFAGSEKHSGGVASGGLTIVEAIVPEGARIAGRTARSLSLLYRHSVTLLGVSRNGQRFRDRVRLLPIRFCSGLCDRSGG